MPFFFFNAKIYSLPSLDNFNQSKAIFLAEHFPEIENQTIQQKWDNLITEFSGAIKARQTNSSVFLAKLDVFKTKRTEISGSRYKLSLKQMIRYFEDFYFLYANEDQNYQLSQNQKEALLKDINEIFDSCDTGINMKCTSALQNFQKSEDWIANTLVNARCNLIRLLHTSYESKHRVGTVYSVHVYNYLAKLANQRGFGIPIKEEIEDIYENGVDLRGISNFFEDNFPQYQQKYQQEILTNLAQELMCALSAIMPVQPWTDEETQVSSTFYNDLVQFLKARFQKYGDVDISKYAQLICALDDNSFEHLILKGKKKTQMHLMGMIKEVLFIQEYLLLPERLIEKPSLQSDALTNQKYRVADALALYKALQEQDQTLIEKHVHTLRHCPQLCVEAVIQNHKIYQLLPPYIKKDSRFVDATVDKIQDLLQVALDKDQEQEINDLLNGFDLVTAGEYMYLNNLRPSLRQHPKVTAHFAEIEKIHNRNVDELNDKASISFGDFFNALKSLSITDVMRMNKFRKKQGKSPIPFIAKYESALEEFISDIRKDIVDSDKLEEHELKRKACEIEDFKFITHLFRPLTPVSFLAKNRNVFEAFIEYQAYQSSFKKLFHLFIQTMFNLSELFKNTVMVLGCAFIFLYFVPLVTNIITPYFFLILGLCCIAYGLSKLFDNNALRLIANFLFYASAFDIHLYIALAYKIYYNISYVIQNLVQIASNILDLFKTSLSIFNSSFFKETACKNDEDSCDSIIFRLEMINEVSAIQKASVLRDLYQQMKHDLGENLIEKPYDIEYQGKAYQLSFKDVCNMSRSSKDEFFITESNCIMRFFRPNTASSQQLEGLALVI